MPVYEYRCLECRRKFEIEEPITKHHDSSVRCPRCGSKKVERHWEGVNLQTSKKS